MNIFEVVQKCLSMGQGAVNSALNLKAGRSAELLWAALNYVQPEEPHLIENLNGVSQAIMKTEANANFQIGALKNKGLIERASNKRGAWRLTASAAKKLERLAEGKGDPSPAPTPTAPPASEKSRPRKTKIATRKKISKAKGKKSAKRGPGKVSEMTISQFIAREKEHIAELDARIEQLTKKKEDIKERIATMRRIIKK